LPIPLSLLHIHIQEHLLFLLSPPLHTHV
jgi:hypothetical protein